jgi:TaqI-like C-terminal specificity domain
MPNMYEYFVAKGLNLVRTDGWFSFIVPDRLGYNAQFVRLRKRILTETCIDSLIYKFPFPCVTADTLVFVFHKTPPTPDWRVTISEFNCKAVNRKQVELLQHPSHAFEYFENAEIMSLVTTISSCPYVELLGKVVESTSGYGGKSSLIHVSQANRREIPTVKGDSIGRYEFRKQYWFDFQRENITGRTTDRTKLGAVPKVLIRKTGDKIIAMFDDSGIFPEQSLYFLFNNHSDLDFKYLLGILNSRLLTVYFRAKSVTNKKSIAQVKKVDLDQLPIRSIDFADTADRERHDRMVSLVEQMLALHRQLAAARTEHEQTNLRRQIDAADRRIDRLVYDLYGLTEEDIRIIEKD